MCRALGTKLVTICALFAAAGPASPALTLIQDQAFIDHRPADDPVVTGLLLHLNARVSDPIGGTAALMTTGTGSYTASNPSYPSTFPTSLPFFQPRSGGQADFRQVIPVTTSQFANIAGTYSYTVTDANGTVMGTTHNLNFQEVLAFPTNITISNHSTTPTIMFTDSNIGALPSGIKRGYILEVDDAAFNGLFQLQSLSPSFALPSGDLVVGHVYNFRVEIVDFETAELGQGIHDPTKDRSVEWAFNFVPAAVPEPGALVLICSGLLGLGAVVMRGHRRE